MNKKTKTAVFRRSRIGRITILELEMPAFWMVVRH
jgi:hypothetical protein